MLRLRLLSSLIFIPLLLAAGWFGEPWASLLVAFFVAAASYEFFDIAARAGFAPLRIVGMIIALSFVGAAVLQGSFGIPAIGGVVAAGTLAVVVARLFRPEATTNFTDWAITLAGALYTGWLLSHMILLRDLPAGRELVIWTLLMTFASDSAAYFAGRAFGRHQLAPIISPKKTWEGAIGSLVATPLVSWLLVVVLGLPGTVIGALALGLVVSVAAQFGDLAESALKRSAQVKDAGGLIPGHGGVLDRADSLTFVAVVVYYFHQWIAT